MPQISAFFYFPQLSAHTFYRVSRYVGAPSLLESNCITKQPKDCACNRLLKGSAPAGARKMHEVNLVLSLWVPSAADIQHQLILSFSFRDRQCQ